jgi:hypothetical protein
MRYVPPPSGEDRSQGCFSTEYWGENFDYRRERMEEEDVKNFFIWSFKIHTHD